MLRLVFLNLFCFIRCLLNCVLFCSILFYSILFYSVLFYSAVCCAKFYSIPYVYSMLFNVYYILLFVESMLSDPIPFHMSGLLYSGNCFNFKLKIRFLIKILKNKI